MRKGALEVISIEEDAKVPDIYGLERFMEEVNILELEGYYFCPNKKEAGRPEKRTITLSDLSERPVTIVFSEYGRPRERAYKVLQAAFLKLSEQGFETDGVVFFSLRELQRLLGISAGGRQSNEIYRAIKQLHRTEINCSIKFKEKVDGTWVKKWRAVSFTIFNRIAFEGSERGRFSRCMIKIDDMVVRNFKNRHISYFNWERMRGLDMVGMMLYKRLFRHMANVYRDGMNKDELVFDKKYESMSTSWLGLKPFQQQSRIEVQLGLAKHGKQKSGKGLQGLKEVRLLRECRLERAKDGSFKVLAYPGQGFFKDYEDFYRRTLPSSSQRAEPEPLLYLTDFHKRLCHEQEEFAPKEVAYARELLARYGDAEVKSLMEFGLAEARKTGFDMQWFGALSLYEGKWQAEREKQAKAAERQAVIAACPVCNEYGFLEFEDGTAYQCPHERPKLALIHRHKPIRGFKEA